MTTTQFSPEHVSTALRTLGRSRLSEITAHFGLDVEDRRVVASHITALMRSDEVKFSDVLALLKREELEAMWKAVDLKKGGTGDRPAAVTDSESGENTQRSGTGSPNGDRRSFDGDRRSFDADRRPPATDRRPSYEDRRSSYGDRRPSYGDRRPSYDDRRPPDRRPHYGDRRGGDYSRSRSGPSRPGNKPRKGPVNVQDSFLFESLKERRRLVFVLATGSEIEGTLKRFDLYSFLVDTGTKEVLLYKHVVTNVCVPQ